MSSSIAQIMPRWRALRLRAFTWRCDLPIAGKVAMAFGMAALTGAMAQLRVPLMPVPVTGQVFAVLLAGVLLGRFYGGLSQVLYVTLGAAGMPWFNGLTGGVSVLLGPTGGYLVGFVVAAELIGYISDRWLAARRFLPQLALMMLGVAVIYACGVLHLVCVLHMTLRQAILLGAAPFVLIDLAKACLAAGVSTALLPKSTQDRS
jgi:biotin transport system substrate-specific component